MFLPHGVYDLQQTSIYLPCLYSFNNKPAIQHNNGYVSELTALTAAQQGMKIK